MSNNFDRFIQCAITKENNRSTFQNWLDFQLTKRIQFTALIGGALIAFTTLLIMGF